MTEYTSVSPNRSTRVLFLAWGYSIHAKRRIQIFIEDPKFDVMVVSNYDYNFKNAHNVLLTIPSKKFVKVSKPKKLNKKDNISNKIHLKKNETKFWDKVKNALAKTRILQHLSLVSLIIKAIQDIKIIKLAVKNFNPEVIFLQTLLYPCYLIYFMAPSIPIIITFWNGDVTWWAKLNGIDRLFKRQIVKYGTRRAKAITVNSQKAVMSCIRYGANENKIHLIRYPGVNLKLFKSINKIDAKKLIMTESRHVVLCPRGLGGYLNSDIIVKAAVEVIDKYPSVLFLFLSESGDKKELKKHLKLVRQLGIENNFRWEGQVPWNSMPSYYNSADVVVSISSNDSLPNCMIESMACGAPVIMGDIPQIREWVVDELNGFLIPPRDPSMLAGKIIKVFEIPNPTKQLFSQINYKLVKRHADSKRNAQKVKNITHLIANEYNKNHNNIPF